MDEDALQCRPDRPKPEGASGEESFIGPASEQPRSTPHASQAASSTDVLRSVAKLPTATSQKPSRISPPGVLRKDLSDSLLPQCDQQSELQIADGASKTSDLSQDQRIDPIATSKADFDVLRGQLKDIKKELESATAQHDALIERNVGITKQLQKKEETLASLESRARETLGKLASADEQHLNLLKQNLDLARQVKTNGESLTSLELRAEDAERRLFDAQEQMRSIEASLDKLTSAVQSKEKELKQLTALASTELNPKLVDSVRRKTQWDAIQDLDKRISQTQDARQRGTLLSTRSTMLEQNGAFENACAERELAPLRARQNLIYQLGLSVACLAAGVILTYLNAQTAGLFILGAGVCNLAPSFVKKFFPGSGRKVKKNVG